MAGTFDKTARPALAGSYFNWEAEQTEDPPASLAGTAVLVLPDADWGPANVLTRVASPSKYAAIFGSTATAAARYVKWAFRGEGLPGKGGADELLVYRMAPGAVAAQINLSNTTPAVALRLTAKWAGTRGNALRATVQASAQGGLKDLILLDGTSVLERYTFTASDVTGLAAQINATSGWVSASNVISGVALADATSVAPTTTGTNGTAAQNSDHVALMALLEATRFSTLGVPGVTADATITAYAAWAKATNLMGKRFRTVLGGGNTDSLTVVGARARAINWPDVAIVGGSILTDDDDGATLYPADQVAMVAGSITGRGERKDLTFVRFDGASFVSGPDLAGQEYAVANGFITFSRDTNLTAPVFIREGVTSYSDDSASPKVAGVKTMPVAMYRRLKNVATQHAVEMEVDDFATSGNVLGDMPVDDQTRGVILGYLKQILQRRVDARIVQEGFTVELDRDPEPSDQQDFVQYRWGFRPTRSLRQMFNTARIG